MMRAEDHAMLQSGDLADLAYWLRQREFAVSTEQLIAAGRLLNGTRRFPDPALLAAYLAPIFCVDLQQQNRFAEVYAAWLQQRGPASSPPLPAPADTASPPPVSAPPADRPRPLWMLLGLLLALALAAIFWRQAHDRLASGLPVETASASAVDQPKPESPPPAAAPSPAPLPAPTATPSPAPAPGKTVYRANWAAIALLSAPLGLFGLWWLHASWRRRGFLQRLPVDGAHHVKRLRSAGARPHDVLVSDVRQLGVDLRRRYTVPSRTLDIDASIAATLRAGGPTKLIFGSRIEAEYLVLVDRASCGDHQARLAHELLGALTAQGVVIERYEFDADPRRARHAPLHGAILHHGPQSLESLASRHAGARLLIFSDGRGFIDPYTGRVAACLSAFGAWPQPVLLTPQARERWGLREWLLARGGLSLVPLTGGGLKILGQLFGDQRHLPGIDQGARARQRPAYLQDVDALLDRIAPPAKTVATLMQALAADLHGDGMAWLCGCAVYPELHWGITLTLGENLIKLGENLPAERKRYTECLAQMVRLPWLRVGFMPDWLRSALLARLSGEHELIVRAALNDFLAAVTEDCGPQTDDVLEVANAAQTGAWRGLRAWLGAGGEPEAGEDKVFLRFMSGPRTHLALDAGARLQRLLYRHGAPLGGLRVLPLLMMVLVLTAGLGVGWPPVFVEQEAPQAVIAKVEKSRPSTSPATVPEVASASASGQDSASAPPVPVPAAASASQTSASTTPVATVVARASAASQGSAKASTVPAAASASAAGSAAAPQEAGAAATSGTASVPTASVPAVPDAGPGTGTAPGKPGTEFRDPYADGFGPTMVVIPAGSFMMGSPDSEPGRQSDEGPQHQVRIAAAFALGKTTVTFDEWDACVKGGGCGGHAPDDRGWGRGAQPAINVNWDDAQRYVAWLSKQTGKSYRLPTEAEWEYAARAGTRSAYYWGETIGKNHANCDGCGSKWDNKQTAPVGSFAENSFGLHDMAGNVWQWTQDCYHENYVNAPTDGSVWIETAGKSNGRVLRGGSWFYNPVFLRAAFRYNYTATDRISYVGLRVARTLP